MKDSGLVLRGEVRGVGVNPNNQKSFVNVEVHDSFGNPHLYKVTTKSNGQKVGDEFQARVGMNMFEGKFFGFREV